MPNEEIDDISIKFQSDTSEVKKDLKNLSTKGAAKAGKEAGKSFFSNFGAAGKALKGAFIAAGITTVTSKLIDFGKKAINVAKQVETFNRRAKTVFGDSLPKIEAAAKKTAAQLGLTTTEFLKAASAAGDLLKPLGFTSEQAAGMSQRVVELAGTLKEFNGDQRDTVEIAAVLTKSFLGEREGLKSLGIAISENDIKVELLARGKSKLTGQTLALEKALITEELLFRKTTDAQKAFADGSDSLSRSSNKLNANLKTLAEKSFVAFGKFLAPTIKRLNEFTDALLDNDNKVENLNAQYSDAINRIPSLIKRQEELNKAQKLSKEETEELIRVNAELAVVESDLNIQLVDEEGNLLSVTDALKKLNDEREEAVLLAKAEGAARTQIVIQQTEELLAFRRLQEERAIDALGDIDAELKALDRINAGLKTGNALIDKRVELTNATEKELKRLVKTIEDLDKKEKKIDSERRKSLGGVTKKLKENTFHLTEFENSLLSLNKGYDEFKKNAAKITNEIKRQRVLEEGQLRFLERRNELVSQERDLIEAASKNELEVRFRAIAAVQRRAIEASRDLTKLRNKELKRQSKAQVKASKGDADAIKEINKKLDDDLEKSQEIHQQEITEIALEAERDRSKARAEIITKAFNKVSETITQINDVVAGKFEDKLQGIGGIIGNFNPAIGAAVSGAGVLLGTLKGIFGQSDDIAEATARRKEEEERINAIIAERVKQEEAILKLVEQQAALQFELANISREEQQTVKELHDLRLQTIRITTTDEAERARLTRVENERFFQEISGGFGFQADTLDPSDLARTAGRGRSDVPVSTEEFLAAQTEAIEIDTQNKIAALQYQNVLSSIGNFDLSNSAEVDAAQSLISEQLQNFRSIPEDERGGFSDAIAGLAGLQKRFKELETLNERKGQRLITERDSVTGNPVIVAADVVRARLEAGIVGSLASRSRVSGLESERLGASISQRRESIDIFETLLEQDREAANSIVDLVEIQEEALEVSKETLNQTIELGKERETSFIDVTRGGAFSLGNVFGQSLQTINTGALSLPATATLQQNTTSNLRERAVLGIEELVVIQKDIRTILNAISGSSIATQGQSDVLTSLNNIANQNPIGGLV